MRDTDLYCFDVPCDYMDSIHIKPLYRREHRCPACRMLASLCLCEAITPRSLKTRISILMHASEEGKTTNTVRLLKLAIPATEITLFGKIGVTGELEIPENVTPLVLYPEPSAPVLDKVLSESLPHPAMLIVPDGTWSQARKLIQRRQNLYAVRRVRIARAEPSKYLLRKNQNPNGLCTLEAVAEALSVLEGPEIKNYLESLLRLMVERTLESRSGRH